MPDQRYDFIDKALQKRRQQNRYRTLRAFNPSSGHGAFVTYHGNEFINFSSNDYLGLSGHPYLQQRAKAYTDQYGSGATASRLICGTYDIHQDLERRLAAYFNREAALVFNTGFQANSSLISTLTTRNSLILTDKRSHNSLLQGSLLSRATFQRFTHNELEDLEQQLKKAEQREYDRIFIVTESVFSMDGDGPDLDALSALAHRFGAFLFIDEAHAVGVWGDQGRGRADGQGRIDLLLGTFGKAFGSFGAFVLCTEKLKKYLINFCPGFIYTTALPPAVIGANEAALTLMPDLEQEREQLHENVRFLRTALHERGFDTGRSSSQIIPLITGSEQSALNLQEYLEKNRILATAIRPPTVPRGKARIRITLSSAHNRNHLEKFLNLLDEWR